jgi:LacI family transcriptional regulator
LPDIRNPFFPEIARGIEDEAKHRGFSVTFCDTDNDPAQQSNAMIFLQSKMIDGVIVTRSILDGPAESFSKYTMPVVVVDRKELAKNDKVGEIIIDTESAFLDITQHLIHSGCKKLAYISALGSSDNLRFQGFLKAIQQEGLSLEPYFVFRSNYDVDTGCKGIEQMLDAGHIPEGIVCGNDLIAVGVMGVLREKGILVPSDIKVTGFDDIYFSRYLNPSLTTIKQPAYEMGVEAARMLIEHIVDGKPLAVKKLDYQLIVRESTFSKEEEA